MKATDNWIKWLACPKCNGRGYFTKNPFLDRPSNPENFDQCKTCEAEYWKQIEAGTAVVNHK